MSRIIGIPSDGPELSDNMSAHFGHCKYFIGVKVDLANNFQKEFAIQNKVHSGCMELVINMKEKNVTDMIIGGIGGRPFMGFMQVGINLYQGINGNLKENVELLLQDKLKPLGGPSCEGGSDFSHLH